MVSNRWVRRGMLFSPLGVPPWHVSHAQAPKVLVVNNELLRVYFSARDASNRTRPLRIDIEVGKSLTVITPPQEVGLELGGWGSFDVDGVMPSCVLEFGDRVYLYYTGWTRRADVPYFNSVGLAVSQDGGLTFERACPGPVLSVTPEEPHMAMRTEVLVEESLWRAWYGVGTGWHEAESGKLEPCYHIRYAESQDGIHWKREGRVAVDFAHSKEGGITDATVYRDEEDRYHLWFSSRNREDYRTNPEHSYSIGYAHSNDGIVWERDDAAVIMEGEAIAGWDTEMQAYPCVVEVDGRLLMFYCGNAFGKYGFGYAELPNP